MMRVRVIATLAALLVLVSSSPATADPTPSPTPSVTSTPTSTPTPQTPTTASSQKAPTTASSPAPSSLAPSGQTSPNQTRPSQTPTSQTPTSSDSPDRVSLTSTRAVPGAPELSRILSAKSRRAAAAQPSLTVEVEPNPAHVMDPIHISGHLMADADSSIPGQKISLANLADEAVVAVTETDDGGFYTFETFAEKLGVYDLAVYFDGDTDHDPVRVEFTVEVVEPQRLTARADDTTVTPGQTVTITGRLTDAGGVPVPDATVEIMIDPSGEVPATAVTSADGSYSLRFTVPPRILEWGAETYPDWPEYHVYLWDDNRDHYPEASVRVNLTVIEATAAPTSTTRASSAPTSVPTTSVSTSAPVTASSLADTGAPRAVGWWLGAGTVCLVLALVLLALRRRR